LDILPQLKEAKVVVVPGRIAHPRVYDPSFKCVTAAAADHLPLQLQLQPPWRVPELFLAPSGHAVEMSQAVVWAQCQAGVWYACQTPSATLWMKTFIGVVAASCMHVVCMPWCRTTNGLALPISSSRGWPVRCRCPWVRLAFSYVPDEELREGMARLGQVLRQLRPTGSA
jgi:hypothetical protein